MRLVRNLMGEGTGSKFNLIKFMRNFSLQLGISKKREVWEKVQLGSIVYSKTLFAIDISRFFAVVCWLIANSGNLWLTGKEAALRSQGESCSPPQLSDITFDAILIGQVNFREDVVSELHCMDLCVRRSSCVAYNMETAGSHVRCTILSDIQKSEKKLGSLYRNFDREKIEKVCVYYFIVKQCYISKNISQGKGKYKDDHSLINEPSDTPLPSPLHTLPSLLPYV